MNRRLVVNPLAEADLVDAKAWYDDRRLGLGDDFVYSVEKVFDRLTQTPELYAKVFGDLRLALVRRFPYAVIYRVDEDQVTVLAVYHTHRDPRGWQEREP